MQRLLWRTAASQWRKRARRLLAVAACAAGLAAEARAEFRPTVDPQRTCSLAAADPAALAWYQLTGQGLRLRLLSDATVGLYDDGQGWNGSTAGFDPFPDGESKSGNSGAPHNAACPTFQGASIDVVLDWVGLAAELGTELAQDWIRHISERNSLDDQTIAPQVARLSEEVGANSDPSGEASSGDAAAAEPAAWCGAMLTAPSGERTTESREESNCTWAGCGGLGPLQWPSPDGGWRQGLFLATRGATMVPQAVAAAETDGNSAVCGSISHLLTGREHVAGDALVRQINALNDGLMRSEWEEWTAGLLAPWRPGRWQWPAIRATDLAAVRSLYFWWDSAQPHRRADQLSNDAARPAAVNIGTSSAATAATEAPTAAPAPFEAIIDGPGRYLYLRSEWTPPSPELLARAQSALTREETAPACGADGQLCMDDERCGDPMEQWVGCDAYARYADHNSSDGGSRGGASAEQTVQWFGMCIAWLIPASAECQAVSADGIALALEIPRLTAALTQEMTALRQAAQSLAAAGGTADTNARQNQPTPATDVEAKRATFPGPTRGL